MTDSPRDVPDAAAPQGQGAPGRGAPVTYEPPQVLWEQPFVAMAWTSLGGVDPCDDQTGGSANCT
jgi:hypothetical protein